MACRRTKPIRLCSSGYLDDEGYQFEVVNAGVSGDTSAGGLRRLDWALDGDPRILILALGANDGLRGVAVEEMTRNLASIIDRSRARGVAVLLAGMEAPPNFGPLHGRLSTGLHWPGAQQENHLCAVPLGRRGGAASIEPVGRIHPTAKGARVIADQLWKALKPMVEQTVSHD